MDADLKEAISLQVICDGTAVFESRKHWLHPLFDLADFLKSNPVDMQRAELRDKIIGLGAALLILRVGVGRVHGDLMSELAVDVFKGAGIPHSFDRSVERIDCQTESILQGIHDPDVAYTILCRRAKRC